MDRPNRPVELVVFDLDDTLYSEWQHALSGWRAVAEALRGALDAPFDLVERMVHHYRSGDRTRVFNALLDDLGRDDADVLVPRMVEIYRMHEPDISLYPDADAALTRLRPNHKLAILTDGPVEKQRTKIVRLGLADRVDAIVMTGQWGEAFWKPHERGFRQLEESTGCSGRACAYVGNDRGKDFVAPNRLGWLTIMVNRPDNLMSHRPPPAGGEPKHTVTSLDDIDEFL